MAPNGRSCAIGRPSHVVATKPLLPGICWRVEPRGGDKPSSVECQAAAQSAQALRRGGETVCARYTLTDTGELLIRHFRLAQLPPDYRRSEERRVGKESR